MEGESYWNPSISSGGYVASFQSTFLPAPSVVAWSVEVYQVKVVVDRYAVRTKGLRRSDVLILPRERVRGRGGHIIYPEEESRHREEQGVSILDLEIRCVFLSKYKGL